MGSGRSNYKITFVTGKGGVGKSVISAAIALAHAQRGKKALLVELGTRSFFEKLFQLRYQAGLATLIPGLSITRWDGEGCLREYLLHYLRLQTATDLFLQNTVMRAIVRAAPALDELSLLGKITSGHRFSWHKLDYDVIVVDAFATGHFMALLRAPRGMNEAVPVGPMGKNSREMMDILRNPDICRYVVVTLPEELPVTETLELHAQIESEVRMRAQIVCNKVLPTEYEPEVLRLSGGQETAGSYLHYLDAYYRRQRDGLKQLEAAVGEVLKAPYCFQSEPLEMVRTLSALM